jgi:outer membrane protein insertion porin family
MQPVTTCDEPHATKHRRSLKSCTCESLPALTRRRRFSWKPVAVAISTIFLIATAPAFGLTVEDLVPSHNYKLERIELSGQHSFSQNQILSVMTMKERPWYQVWKPPADFDPQTFTDDLPHIRRFYQAHGYYRAHVNYNLTLDKNKVTIHLKVAEGKPVRVAAIETKVAGGAPLPRELEPSFKLPLKKGDIFDQDTYQAAGQKLLNIYKNHSYAHAKLQRHAIVELGPLQALVRYELIPGVRCVFGGTSIVGSEKVSPELVREQLTYKPGEAFDPRKIVASRDAIVALNVFSAVDAEQGNNPSDPTIVPITISLHEGPKHTLSVGVGYNTETQLNAMIGWTDYNFLGGGRRLSLTGTYSDVTSAFDVKLFQPRFFSPSSSLTLEASQQQQTYQTYTGNISGFDPHIDYKASSSLTFSAGWRLEYLKFNSVNASTIEAIGGFRRSGILSGPTAGLTFNNTEDPFNPQSGEIVSVVGNVSDDTFGADYRYWRVVSEVRKYYLIGWQTVLATRLKAGLSDTLDTIGDVPLSERFYSGGESSVRGYGLRRIGPLSASNDPLGGLSLIEGSAELRRPLFWKLNGALFVDCGQVATKAYDLRVDALQCGYGPAAGIDSPVGPINFYIGFPTQKPKGDSSWQFYFSIGQYF